MRDYPAPAESNLVASSTDLQHALLYTCEAERLGETLRDVLGWDSVEGHDRPTAG